MHDMCIYIPAAGFSLLSLTMRANLGGLNFGGSQRQRRHSHEYYYYYCYYYYVGPKMLKVIQTPGETVGEYMDNLHNRRRVFQKAVGHIHD